MTTLFAAKCRPKHVLTLVASLIQVSYFLFTPSPPSSGNHLTLSSTRTIPPPTIKTPTRTTIPPPTSTTAHNDVNNSSPLGLYLGFCALIVGFLFGLVLATVYTRTGGKPIHPSPLQTPLSPPNNLTKNDDFKDTADSDDSDPDNSGNDTPGDGNDGGDGSDDITDEQDADNSPSEGDGDGDDSDDTTDEQDADNSPSEGDGDGSDDITDKQDADNSPSEGDSDSDDSDDTTDEQEDDNPPSEKGLHDEPDPEDPPPPLSTALDENDDYPRMTFNGPALSLLHFLLGAVGGLLTRLVTMNATSYRRELRRLLRGIASRSFSTQISIFSPRLSDSPIVELPYSCHSQPFIIATAQLHHPSRRRHPKVSLPASLTIVIKYAVDTVARLSPLCVSLADTIRPALDTIARLSPLCVSLADSIRPAVDTIARLYPLYVSLADTIRPPVNWFIHAMAQDLVVVEACISLAIDRVRTIDIDHGSSLRLIAGCTVLLLVILEVYNAKLPASPAHTDLYYGDDILFPFAEVDFPLDSEDSESLQVSTVKSDYLADNNTIFPFRDVDLPLVEEELDSHFDENSTIFPFRDVDLPLVEKGLDDHFEETSTVFPFHDVDLALLEEKLDDFTTGQTIVVDPIASFDHSTNEIEPVFESEAVHCHAMEEVMEEVSADCVLDLSLGSMGVEQVEDQTEANKDVHEANNTLADELLSSAYDEDLSLNVCVYALAVEDDEFVEIATSLSSDEDPDSVTFEEDPDAVLDCLAGLFDSSYTDCPLHIDATEDEENATTPSAEDSHTELTVEEDPDTILECIADLFDSPFVPSSAEEEDGPGSPLQHELALVPVSPSRASGDVRIRAFTSCGTFAEMFGYENERPLEFLRPLPAHLERLLPPYAYLTHTPARYFTLGGPSATPTTPYARWMEEDHQSTPFVPSPFGPPRTPPCTPPTIVIPSPTSSEGTQPADESPAAIRARRLDRKWAKIMAKRQRNEARNCVPRIQIEETSFSSSLASNTSIKSFFDPHASINQEFRRTKVEAEPAKTTKWKARSPGDPVPQQRRRWRRKDVLVGAGEDESYGAVAAAVD